MAYAYKAIDELMNPEQQKQNIFAQEQSQGQQPNQPGQQGGVKTSTEGELGAGGGSSSVSEGVAPPPTDSGQADRAAFRANAGKTAQPKAIADVQGQLQQRQQTLQDDANKYMEAGKAGQNYALGNQDYDQAIAGNQEKRSATQSLLNRKNINAVQDFKAGDVDVKDANLLNNDAGLRQLASRGQDPQYTQGMASFDVRSLRRTPDFNNILQLIQGQQEGLRQNARNLEQSKRRELEDYGAKQLSSAQEAARGYLGGQASAIDQSNEQEASAANTRLKEYREKGAVDAQSKALEDAKAALRAKYEQNDPRYARFVDQAESDPRKYLQVRGDYGRDDFVDDQESSRFNSIMGLLGQSDARMSSAPRGADFNIDRNAMERDLISGTESLRGTEDERLKGLIAKMQKTAQGRADEDDVRRSGLNLSDISSREGEELARKYGLSSRDVDASQFISRDDRDLSAADVYSREEADQLNQMYGDLGLADRVSAGGGVGGAGYNFDRGAYQSALEKFMADRDASSAKEEESRRAAEARSFDSASVADQQRMMQKSQEDFEERVRNGTATPEEMKDFNSASGVPGAPKNTPSYNKDSYLAKQLGKLSINNLKAVAKGKKRPW